MKIKTNKNIAIAAIFIVLSLLFIPVASAAADTTPPSFVEGVRAFPGDGMVKLTWNVATDNEMVAGYKLYYGKESVKVPKGKYSEGEIDVGNKISYELTGLENGTTYYFAVTAYDPSDNESGSYSLEVSATPAHGAADTESPIVGKAEAIDKYTVLVTFSEEVVLPEADPQAAFGIKEDVSSLPLEVLSAAVNLEDTSKKTVLLSTAEQKAGAEYILTAGIQVQDKSGNPVKSGTSDTARFTGTDLAPKEIEPISEPVAEADTTGPQLIDVQIPDNTHVKLAFSEVLKLGTTPEFSFVITEEENIQKSLKVTKAELSADGDLVTLTTATQEGKNYSLTVLEDVTDEAGNMIDITKNEIVFFGGVTPTEETVVEEPEIPPTGTTPTSDMTPPEDATDFNAALLENLEVVLSWTPSINSAGDLANFIIYKSTDGTEYGEGVILNPTDKSYNVANLLSGVTYFFKLTAKDASGNESAGVTTAFKLELPQTGPELLFFLLGSAGVGRLMMRRKKNIRKK